MRTKKQIAEFNERLLNLEFTLVKCSLDSIKNGQRYYKKLEESHLRLIEWFKKLK